MYIKCNLLLFVFMLFCSSSCQYLQSTKNNYFLLKKTKPVVKKLWVRKTFVKNFYRPSIKQNIKPVLTSAGLVIQGNKTNGVHAYTIEKGKKQWFFKLKGGLSGGVLVHKNRVFFGSADGFIYALHLKTGKQIWKQYIGATNISTPTLRKKYLYLASPHKIYCLNTKNGSQVWTYLTQIQSTKFTRAGVARLVVGKSYLYFGSDSYFMALNFKGRLQWKHKISYAIRDYVSVTAAVAIGKICVYFTHSSAGVYCLNKKTGDTIWKTNIGSHGEILLSGSWLFFASHNENIIALDQNTGKQIWTHKVSNSMATSPVLYNNSTLVYGAYSSGVLKFIAKKTGKVLGSFVFGGGSGVSVSPIISLLKSNIYFMSNSGWLYKISYF